MANPAMSPLMMAAEQGHADVVMDDVGPQVIPSVALIRERFTVVIPSDWQGDGVAIGLVTADSAGGKWKATGAALVDTRITPEKLTAERPAVLAVGRQVAARAFNDALFDFARLPRTEPYLLEPASGLRRP